MHTTRSRTAGLTLVEALLATALLLVVLVYFASVAAQSARTFSTGQVSTFAADALSAAAQAAQRGNPLYTQARTMANPELRLLAQSTGRRAALSATLNGVITPVPGNPPRVQISVTAPNTGVTVSETVTVPGGTP